MSIKTKLFHHPETGCASVESLYVELGLQADGALHLRYELSADRSQLLIPAPMPPGMADGLWQHTCFEAFIAVAGDKSYREFNFSPSGQWAAYAFSDYRTRSDWNAAQPPFIQLVQTDKLILLDTEIGAVDMPSNPDGMPLQIGLAAVIETSDGCRSYWALHHPAAAPDFHLREAFCHFLKPGQ